MSYSLMLPQKKVRARRRLALASGSIERRNMQGIYRREASGVHAALARGAPQAREAQIPRNNNNNIFTKTSALVFMGLVPQILR